MALPPPDPASTCLVTGASSGIGADLARELAERGLGVTLVARREERLRELAAELSEAHGVRVESLACDLADGAARDRMVAAVGERGLTVEVLVNNAGFGGTGRFQERDPAAEVGMVRTNVEAVVELCAAYVPGMVERGRGAILNVASTAAFQPGPRNATYSATKAFVLSFTEALRDDLTGTGVTATALCPGPVRTEFMEAAGMGDIEERTPRLLWMSSRDVARAGVRALEKGRRVVVPGPLNQLGAIAGQHAPRSLLLPFIRRASPLGK